MKKWLPVYVITALLALFATAPSWSQAVRATLVTFGGTGQPVTQSGTWTVQPGNTANTTAWKVDGSAVTQPVSGTVTANQGGTWTVQPGNTANTTAWLIDARGPAAHDAAASGNPLLQGAYASAAAPSDVSADGDAVRVWALRNGAQAVQPTYAGILQSTGNGTAGTGTPRVTIASDNTAFTVNAAQSGTWTVQPGNTANSTPWLTTDGATSATGSAPPAKAGYLGGVTSGATGGLLGGITTCDSQAFLDMTTATTTELVALTASRKVYVCYWLAEANGTTVMTFKRGTGTNCGTGTTTISNAWDLVAQVGFSGGGGLGAIFDNQNAGDALCVTSSAAVNLHVYVRYAKY